MSNRTRRVLQGIAGFFVILWTFLVVFYFSAIAPHFTATDDPVIVTMTVVLFWLFPFGVIFAVAAVLRSVGFLVNFILLRPNSESELPRE